MVQRDDDREETVKKRRGIREQTRPLIDYYRNGPPPANEGTEVQQDLRSDRR